MKLSFPGAVWMDKYYIVFAFKKEEALRIISSAMKPG
jgi:hypothetical protein